MISAMTAANIAETARANRQNAWLQLEETIIEAAEKEKKRLNLKQLLVCIFMNQEKK